MDNMRKVLIEEALKEKGYTRTRFAEDVLGITRNNFYRKLNKNVKLTKLEKEKIREVLGVEVD